MQHSHDLEICQMSQNNTWSINMEKKHSEEKILVKSLEYLGGNVFMFLLYFRKLDPKHQVSNHIQ